MIFELNRRESFWFFVEFDFSQVIENLRKIGVSVEIKFRSINQGLRVEWHVAKAIYQYDLESNINQILSEQGSYSFGGNQWVRVNLP